MGRILRPTQLVGDPPWETCIEPRRRDKWECRDGVMPGPPRDGPTGQGPTIGRSRARAWPVSVPWCPDAPPKCDPADTARTRGAPWAERPAEWGRKSRWT